MVSYGRTFTGTAVTLTGPTAATQVLTAKINTDTSPQFAIDANGKLEWGSGAAPSDVSLQRDGSVRLHTVNSMVTEGNFICDVAGGGLQVREGSNCRQGVATLVAGTVTVSNTTVTANTRIQLTAQSLGTVTAPKALAVTARTAGTSFTITSADATDTSVVAYTMTEPAP